MLSAFIGSIRRGNIFLLSSAVVLLTLLSYYSWCAPVKILLPWCRYALLRSSAVVLSGSSPWALPYELLEDYLDPSKWVTTSVVSSETVGHVGRFFVGKARDVAVYVSPTAFKRI